MLPLKIITRVRNEIIARNYAQLQFASRVIVGEADDQIKRRSHFFIGNKRFCTLRRKGKLVCRLFE